MNDNQILSNSSTSYRNKCLCDTPVRGNKIKLGLLPALLFALSSQTSKAQRINASSNTLAPSRVAIERNYPQHHGLSSNKSKMRRVKNRMKEIDVSTVERRTDSEKGKGKGKSAKKRKSKGKDRKTKTVDGEIIRSYTPAMFPKSILAKGATVESPDSIFSSSISTVGSQSTIDVRVNLIVTPPSPVSSSSVIAPTSPPTPPTIVNGGAAQPLGGMCSELDVPSTMSTKVVSEINLVFGGNKFILEEEDIPIFESTMMEFFQGLNNDWTYFQECVKLVNQYPLSSQSYQDEKGIKASSYNNDGDRNFRNLGIITEGNDEEDVNRSGTGVTLQSSVYIDPRCNGCPDPQTIQLDDINLKPSQPSLRRMLQQQGNSDNATDSDDNNCDDLIPCLRKQLPQYFNTVDDVMATAEPLPLDNIVLCYLNWSIVMQDRASFLTCEQFFIHGCGEIPEQCYCLDPCIIADQN